MCQVATYLLKDGKEEEISRIIPVGKKVRLISLFGEEKAIKTSREEVCLRGHEILPEPQ
jgi:predicted RNA-binding protein